MKLRFFAVRFSLGLFGSLLLGCSSEGADPGISPGAAGGGGRPAVCDPAVVEPGDACHDTAEPGDLCHLGPRGSCDVLNLICRNGVWTLLGDEEEEACLTGGQAGAGGADQGGADQGGADQGGADQGGAGGPRAGIESAGGNG